MLAELFRLIDLVAVPSFTFHQVNQGRDHRILVGGLTLLAATTRTNRKTQIDSL